MESGITALVWSPDFEVLILGTGKGTILAMTKDWEVLTEVQATHVVHAVSWRGDGAFFATSGPTLANGTTELVVWERTCALHSRATLGSGEQLHTGSGLLAWRPSGQIIAAFAPSVPVPPPSTPPASQRVIFFERNGLRHGEFTLRGTLPHGHAHQAGWSCDSEILALLVDGTVQLWHSSNYHWSLKREILRADRAKSQALGFEWDPEDPRCIRTLSQGTISQRAICAYCN